MMNEYEQLRRDNIARNHSKLRKLGLEPRTQPAFAASSNGKSSNKSKKRTASPTFTPANRPTRAARVNYREGVRDRSRGREGGGAGEEDTDEEDVERDGGEVDGVYIKPDPEVGAKASIATKVKVKRDPNVKPEVKKNENPSSSKNLSANIKLFEEEFLCKEIPKDGGKAKAPVMEMASLTRRPTFNKMSGIQEWQNCVFLFVNIGGSCYNNVFTHEGEYMSWFAQPTQTEESAVVHRLIHSLGSTPVLLFCRLPDQPYVYCGSLGYESHNAGRSPIKFMWRLLDFHKLKAEKWFKAALKY